MSPHEQVAKTVGCSPDHLLALIAREQSRGYARLEAFDRAVVRAKWEKFGDTVRAFVLFHAAAIIGVFWGMGWPPRSA
jgi:hypothetical protein